MSPAAPSPTGSTSPARSPGGRARGSTRWTRALLLRRAAVPGRASGGVAGQEALRRTGPNYRALVERRAPPARAGGYLTGTREFYGRGSSSPGGADPAPPRPSCWSSSRSCAISPDGAAARARPRHRQRGARGDPRRSKWIEAAEWSRSTARARRCGWRWPTPPGWARASPSCRATGSARSATKHFELIVSNPPYVAAPATRTSSRATCASSRVAPFRRQGRRGLDDLAEIVAGARHAWSMAAGSSSSTATTRAASARGLLADADFAAIASWADLAGIRRVSGALAGARGRFASVDAGGAQRLLFPDCLTRFSGFQNGHPGRHPRSGHQQRRGALHEGHAPVPAVRLLLHRGARSLRAAACAGVAVNVLSDPDIRQGHQGILQLAHHPATLRQGSEFVGGSDIMRGYVRQRRTAADAQDADSSARTDPGLRRGTRPPTVSGSAAGVFIHRRVCGGVCATGPCARGGAGACAGGMRSGDSRECQPPRESHRQAGWPIGAPGGNRASEMQASIGRRSTAAGPGRERSGPPRDRCLHQLRAKCSHTRADGPVRAHWHARRRPGQKPVVPAKLRSKPSMSAISRTRRARSPSWKQCTQACSTWSRADSTRKRLPAIGKLSSNSGAGSKWRRPVTGVIA